MLQDRLTAPPEPDIEMSTDEPLVTVVEDDQSVREMLCAVLANEGYAVAAHGTGEAALADPSTSGSGLVILDVGLPGRDGIDVCRRLRQEARVGPVLMLTARHEVADRVAGLDAGADDYLVKPFALDELLARVRALLRRGVEPTSTSAESRLVLDDLVVDPLTREAHRGGRTLDLTRIEFELLALLVRHGPAVMTREVIHDRIWGYDEDHMSNSLEVFVSQLRRKTEADDRPRLIHTVRGVGYVARSTAAS